jgi:hypothetical protein
LKLLYFYINNPLTLTNPGESIFVLVDAPDIISNLTGDRPSHYGGRDSVASIATRYGLKGPGIEFRWGRDFQHPSRSVLRPTQPPIPWVPGLSRGKAAGAWR